MLNGPQVDRDDDGFGDVCDSCPDAASLNQDDADQDGVGDACDTCIAPDDGEWCVNHPALGVFTQSTCLPDRQADGNECCPLGTEAVDGTCPLPDLFVDTDRLEDRITIETKTFSTDSCELVEGCIGDSGDRRLLRFDTTTPNQGVGHLHFGDPETASDLFVYSDCHGHYHFETYAEYDLRDNSGNIVADGHKQAFCLMDFEPYDNVTWFDAQYDCGYQGISAGFADTYSRELDCQFVDITGVAPGDYELTVRLNIDQMVAEADYDNNSTAITVQIP